MKHLFFWRTACLLGFLAVLMGALGAHGPVHDRLMENQTLSQWQTAVLYQFIHTLVVLILAQRLPFALGPATVFLLGILFFSGGLYLFAFTGLRWLGTVTPIGGTCFMVGWLWLIFCPPSARRADS